MSVKRVSVSKHNHLLVAKQTQVITKGIEVQPSNYVQERDHWPTFDQQLIVEIAKYHTWHLIAIAYMSMYSVI